MTNDVTTNIANQPRRRDYNFMGHSRGLTPDQQHAIRCAYADLIGAQQAFDQGDGTTHDWEAHAISASDLAAAFPDLDLDGDQPAPPATPAPPPAPPVKSLFDRDLIVSHLPSETYLDFVGPNENFDDRPDILASLIEDASLEMLDAVSWVRGEGYDTAIDAYIIEACLKAYPNNPPITDDLPEDLYEELRQIIGERDQSTPIADMLRNTRDVAVRVELISTHDCANSEGHEGAYQYDSYVGHAIDALGLCPEAVKDELLARGCPCTGEWPDNPLSSNAPTQPLCGVMEFVDELQERGAANLLAFVGLVNPSAAYAAAPFQRLGYVNVSERPFGFFGPLYGSGSPFDNNLLPSGALREENRCVELQTHMRPDQGWYWRVKVDAHSRYSMDDVYGPTVKFWCGRFADALFVDVLNTESSTLSTESSPAGTEPVAA